MFRLLSCFFLSVLIIVFWGTTNCKHPLITHAHTLRFILLLLRLLLMFSFPFVLFLVICSFSRPLLIFFTSLRLPCPEKWLGTEHSTCLAAPVTRLTEQVNWNSTALIEFYSDLYFFSSSPPPFDLYYFVISQN